LPGLTTQTGYLSDLPAAAPTLHPARMDHDELLELAAQELAAALEQIEQRGTCPECLTELFLTVDAGMRKRWTIQPDLADFVSDYFTYAAMRLNRSHSNSLIN